MMRRSEALKLVGQIVQVRTDLWGGYLGELVAVTADRPWRGKVRILAVTEYPAQTWSMDRHGWRERQPFEHGEIREFGNSSVAAYAGKIPDYRQSLRAALDKSIAHFEDLSTRSLESWVSLTLSSLRKHRDAL